MSNLMTENPSEPVALKYRKTALIEAVQWWKMGDHHAVVLKSDKHRYADEGIPWIDTLEGGHIVTPGDWIATGVKGEHWPIKPDIFAATYEPATRPTAPASSELVEPSADALRAAIKVGVVINGFEDDADAAAAKIIEAYGHKRAAEALRAQPTPEPASSELGEMIEQLRQLARKQDGYGMSLHDQRGGSASINLYGDRARAAIWLFKNANRIADALTGKVAL